MADNGKVDVKKYQAALDSANKLFKTQELITESVEKMNSMWDSVATSLFNLSGADFFKKVKKTPDEIKASLNELNKMEIKFAGISKETNTAMGNFLKANDSISKSAIQASKNQISKLTKELDVLVSAREDFDNKIKQSDKEQADSILERLKKNNKLTEEGLKQQKDFSKLSKDQKEYLKNQIKISEKNKEIDISSKSILDSIKEGDPLYQKMQLLKSKGLETEALSLIQGKELTEVLGRLSEGEAMDLVNTLLDGNDAAIKMTQEFYNTGGQIEKNRKKLQETEKSIFSLTNAAKKFGAQIGKDIMGRFMEFDQSLHDIQKSTSMDMHANVQGFQKLTYEASEFGMSIEEAAGHMSVLSEGIRTVDTKQIMAITTSLIAVEKATGASKENIDAMAIEMTKMGGSSSDIKESFEFANKTAAKFGVSAKSVVDSLGKNLKRMREFGFVGGEKSLVKMIATAERLRIKVDDIFNVAEKARTIEGAMEMAAELQLAGGSFSNVNPMDLLSAARKGPKELTGILTKMGGDIGKFSKETGKFEFDPVDVDRLQIVAKTTGMSLDALQEMIRKNAEDNKKTDLFPKEMFKMEGFDPEEAKAMMSDALMIDEKGNIKVKEDGLFAGKSIEELKKMSSTDLKTALNDKMAKKKALEDQAKQNQSFADTLKAFKDALINIFTFLQPVLEPLAKAFTWFGGVIRGFMGLFTSATGKFFAGVTLLVAFGLLFKASVLKHVAALAKSAIGGAAGLLRGGAGAAAGAAGNAAGGAGIGGSLTSLATGLATASTAAKGISVGGIAKIALSVALLLAPIAGMALLFGKLGGDVKILLAMGLAIVELAFALWLASKVTLDIKNIVLLALGMGIIGLALIPFAFAAAMLTDVNWGAVIAAIALLTIAVIALAIVGSFLTGPLLIGFIVAAVAMIVVAGALWVFGQAIIGVATGLGMMAKIDTGAFFKLVGALFALIPAFGALALVGLMFLNPFTLVGLFLMIGMLNSLSQVMTPVADAFERGASAMEKFSNNIKTLKDSVSGIDLAKLEELGEISKAFSSSSPGAGMAQAISELKSAINEAKTAAGGGEKELKAEIIVKIDSETLYKTMAKFKTKRG